MRRDTGKEVSVLREASSRVEAEVERLRLEAERNGSAAHQEIQRLRSVSYFILWLRILIDARCFLLNRQRSVTTTTKFLVWQNKSYA